MAKLLNIKNILLTMVVSLVGATLTSAQFDKYHYKYHHQNNAPASAPAPSVPPLYSFADECMEKLGVDCGDEIINKTIEPIDVRYECCYKLQVDVGKECYKAIINATLDEITDISPEDKQQIREYEDIFWGMCRW